MYRQSFRITALLVLVAAFVAAWRPEPRDLTLVKVVRTEIGGAAGRIASFVAGMRGRDMERVEETLLSGNRMRVNGEREARIIDLDAETITMIDHDEKVVRVVEFAEFREMLPTAMAGVDSLMEQAEEVQREMPETDGEPALVMDLTVEETGETRDFFGQQARRVFVTMQGELREDDALAGQDESDTEQRGGTLVLFADLWMVEEMPGQQELHDFSMRMAELFVGGDPAEFFADRGEDMPNPMTMAGHGKALIRLQEATDGLDGEPIRSATYVVTVPDDRTFDRQLVIDGESATEPEEKKSKLGGLARGLLRRATGQEDRNEVKVEVKQRTLLSMIEETTEVSERAIPAGAFDPPEGYRRVEGLFGR